MEDNIDDGRIVLKLGGSLLFDEDGRLNTKEISNLVQFIKKHHENISCVIVGGGKIARIYISGLRTLGINQGIQDLFGIRVSRVNALMLATLAGPGIAYQEVPGSLGELVRVKSLVGEKLVFAGGLEAGQSTTSVACEVAESLGRLPLVICTDVDGIYTGNPRSDPDARLLRKATLTEIESILGLKDASNQQAGEYRILDTVSVSIIKRSRLHARIIKGDVESMEKAVRGEDIGTLILP